MGVVGESDNWNAFLKGLLDSPQYKSFTDRTVSSKDAKDASSLCEEVSHFCWARCNQENASLKKKLVELNLNSMKEIMALKQKMDRKFDNVTNLNSQDLISFHDPMQYLDNKTQELVILLAEDKIKSLVAGLAPRSLVRRIGESVPIIEELHEWKPRCIEAQTELKRIQEELSHLHEVQNQLQEANTTIQIERRKLKELGKQAQESWNLQQCAAESLRASQRRSTVFETQLKEAEDKLNLLESRDVSAEQALAKLREEHEAVLSDRDQKQDIIEAFEADAIQNVLKKGAMVETLASIFSKENSTRDCQLLREALQGWHQEAMRNHFQSEMERRVELATRKIRLQNGASETAQTKELGTQTQEWVSVADALSQTEHNIACSSTQTEHNIACFSTQTEHNIACSSTQTENLDLRPLGIREMLGLDAKEDSQMHEDAAPKRRRSLARLEASTQTTEVCTLTFENQSHSPMASPSQGKRINPMASESIPWQANQSRGSPAEDPGVLQYQRHASSSSSDAPLAKEEQAGANDRGRGAPQQGANDGRKRHSSAEAHYDRASESRQSSGIHPWRNLKGEPVDIENVQQKIATSRRPDSQLPPASLRTPRATLEATEEGPKIPVNEPSLPQPAWPRRGSRLAHTNDLPPAEFDQPPEGKEGRRGSKGTEGRRGSKGAEGRFGNGALAARAHQIDSLLVRHHGVAQESTVAMQEEPSLWGVLSPHQGPHQLLPQQAERPLEDSPSKTLRRRPSRFSSLANRAITLDT